MGEKLGYYRGQNSGIKPSRRSMNEIQEQLQAQQKETEEERRKRDSVEDKLIEVQKKLEEEQENREVMEACLVRDQKMVKEGIKALVSHMQISKSGLPSAILNIIIDSSDSDVANPTSLMNDIRMQVPRISIQHAVDPTKHSRVSEEYASTKSSQSSSSYEE